MENTLELAVSGADPTHDDQTVMNGAPERLWPVGDGGASDSHPTLRRGAKDGAPELLGLVKVGYPPSVLSQKFVELYVGPSALGIWLERYLGLRPRLVYVGPSALFQCHELMPRINATNSMPRMNDSGH